MIDYEEVRKEVAVNHNTLLDKNDPALIMATINEAVLKRYVEFLNLENESHRKAIDGAMAQGIQVAKKTSERIITDAAALVSDQAHNAIDTTMDEWREDLRKDFNFVREELRKDLRLAWNKIDQARKVTMFSAAVSSVSALIAVLAMLNVA